MVKTRRRMHLVAARDKDRPHTFRPFRAEMDGHAWDAATDGKCLLMMKEPCEFEPLEDSPPVHKVMPKGEPSRTYQLEWEPLIDWAFCGDVCESCGGEGGNDVMIMDDGSPYPGLDRCSGCEGTGFGRPRYGKFRGSDTVFDRRLLWKVLQPTPPGEIEAATWGPLDPIRLIGDAWIAIIMPMRWDEELNGEPAIFEGAV